MSPLNDYDAPPRALSVNLLDVVRGIARRWKLVSALALLGILAGIGIVKLIKPSYSTEAIVLVDNLETPYDKSGAASDTRTVTVDDRIVASQVAVIKSDDLGSRVIAELGLTKRLEFDPLLSRKPLGTLKTILIGFGFAEDPNIKTPEQRALDRYSDKLTVFPLPQSNVITIKYSSSDPQTAAEVANRLAEIYVGSTREAQSQPTERAREWLSKQIEGLRGKVAESEAAVERYRSEAGLLQGATTSTLGAQQISELNSQITVAGTARAEAQAKASSIRKLLASKGNVDTSADVMASPTIQSLRQQQIAAMRTMSELSAVYLDNHPKMMAARKDLTNINRQITAEALKIVAGLEEQADIAAAREESLKASLEDMKTRQSSDNLSDVKLKALEREAAADRALLESLLNRYADASARQSVSAQPGLARIIQRAGVPTSPLFPKIGPTILLTSIAGTALGLGLAFLFEIMSAAQRMMPRQREEEHYEPAPAPALPVTAAPPGVMRTPESEGIDLPDSLAVRRAVQREESRSEPLLPVAVLPTVSSAPGANAAISSSEIAAAAGRLSQWCEGVAANLGAKVVGIASLGGSSIDAGIASVALARQLASRNRRSAVLDLGREPGQLEVLFGVPSGPGLTDLVNGSADFTKVLVRDSVSNVHLLRAGLDKNVSVTRLVEQNLPQLLAAMSNIYDFVVVHCGEAAVLTPEVLKKCGAALILSPSHRKRDAAVAVQVLMSAGVRSVQVVRLDGMQNLAAAE
jgi:polysaccharide biosynthesis transport protein